MIIVAAANWRVPGALLITAGTLLNLVVVVLNAGMPYDPETTLRVTGSLPADQLHVPITSETKLAFLADVIPLAVIRSMYSLGDFLGALGGFLIPFMWLQPPVEAATGRRDLRSPNFAFFWLAQVISRFGDPITLVALAYVTYRMTSSALLTALAVLTATLPSALLGFFGGPIADSLGHRRAMLACDVVRACTIGVIPVLIGLGAPLLFVFLAVFVAGACAAIFNPARIAILPSLLKPERLGSGNSLVYASDRAVEIGGALAGGILVAVLAENVFYVDAITFGLSALLLSRVSLPEVRRPLTLARVVTDAWEGLILLRRSDTLWANTLFSLTAQVSNPVINGLTPVFLVQRFAGNDPVLGAVQYGISEASIAFGAVVGSVVLPRYLTRLRKGTLLVAGFCADGLIIVLIAFAPTFPVVVGLFAALGLANVAFYLPNVMILQEATTTETRARVLGARIALVNLSWLPIIFLSGSLADRLGPGVLIGVAGLITLTTALVGTRVRSVYGAS